MLLAGGGNSPVADTGGAGAGGATALAQAALQSKKGVSASIEQQEANNERLRAQGEQQMEQLKMQEGARIQGIQINEGGRTQGLGVAGKQFMFNTQENREGAQLDRLSAQLSGAQGQAMQASAARQSNTAGLISGLAGVGGSYITGLAAQNASPYSTASSYNPASGFTDAMNDNNMFNVDTGTGFNFTPNLTPPR
jgi:hypothetical protein